MRVNELFHKSQPNSRGSVAVVIAARDSQQHVASCLESVQAHAPADTPVVRVAPTTAAVNDAIGQLAPRDVVVLDEACRVSGGWLERLRESGRSDTNTATASALAATGTELALSEEGTAESLEELADNLARRTLSLRPRLSRAVGPCVYVRREAIELVGPLDEELELQAALEVDLAQRCLLSGLAHVSADDVVVERLERAPRTPSDQVPRRLLDRYPYLARSPPLGESASLAHALAAARGPQSRLWVTLDARALDGAVTGTQVNILELILALARTGALRMRVLVREGRIDHRALEVLRGLPETEVLAEEGVDDDTPRSTVFHRPQQAFSAEDVEFAMRLGERIVLSQLDLIAYRNPGYFADASSWADFRRASRHGLSAAERVVVFSDHTRRELLADALVEDARIRIVPPGLDHRASEEGRRPSALDELEDRLVRGFLLCLGTDFRHKNRIFALRLLEALRREHNWQGSLVLAGTHIPFGSSLELERAFLEQHPALGEAVVRLGPVGEQEKAWLLAHASAVVYPSVYEGFGLVPFESALSGVPCIFAPQSSLAEAAPEDTATILPWDASQSAAATYALLTDAEARAQHVQALARAAGELTWAAAASAMVDVYRETAQAPVREAATLSRDAVDRERRLTSAHEAVVRRLIGEREHARRMYDDLNAEVGSGLSLIGPHGSLPDNAQRALLTISARPVLRRPLYGALARLFVASRALSRVIGALFRRPR
jgi:glycosyltransferase involved in cell wall biosynthesis